MGPNTHFLPAPSSSPVEGTADEGGGQIGAGQLALAGLAVAGAIALLLALGLSLGGNSGSAPGVNSQARRGQIEPRPAPDFVLMDLNGREVSPVRMRGRVVVLNFFASWCAPCQVEAPVLESFWRESDQDRIALMGIGLWDQEDGAREFALTHDLSFPLALDDSGAIGIEYGVAGVPETFVIDRNGVLVGRWIGPLTEGTLQELTAPALAATGG